MEKFILVATDEERQALIPNISHHVIVTGVGQQAVLKTIQRYEIPKDAIIINIGYAASKDFVQGAIVAITNSQAYAPEGLNSYQYPVMLKSHVLHLFPSNIKLEMGACFSSNYFTKEMPSNGVVDMELYTIANMFDNVYSIKVISDSGNEDSYNSALYERSGVIQKTLQNMLSEIYKFEKI